MEVLAILSVCLLVSLCHSASTSHAFVPKFNKDRDQSKWPLTFCRDLDCPSFTALKNVKGEYEERVYSASQWVSTNSAGVDYAEAYRTNIMRLFKYICGKNSAGEKIKMTAPVIMKIIPGPGPACESNFTMSFFVALDNPPTPTDTEVSLKWFPSFKAYVRSFGGYHMGSITPWLKQAEKLRGYLNGTRYNTDYYYTAGYDSPFTLFNRHNEVWFIAE